jgi:hypothetical protein
MSGGLRAKILLALLALPQEQAIRVPAGAEPVLDGALSPEEWADALELPFPGGEALFLKRSGTEMFVGVKGVAGGFVSLGFASLDSLRILHASTGLITASYSHAPGGWTRIHGFRDPVKADGTGFPRTLGRQAETYQLACYDQFGWTANLVEVGPPSDFEFKINVSRPTGEPSFLSIVMYQAQANPRIARAPAGLKDDAVNIDLLQGTAVADPQFDVRSWIPLPW